MNELLAKYRSWRAARELSAQLGNLSPRQLADLGIARSGNVRRPNKDLGVGPYFY